MTPSFSRNRKPAARSCSLTTVSSMTCRGAHVGGSSVERAEVRAKGQGTHDEVPDARQDDVLDRLVRERVEVEHEHRRAPHPERRWDRLVDPSAWGVAAGRLRGAENAPLLGLQAPEPDLAVVQGGFGCGERRRQQQGQGRKVDASGRRAARSRRVSLTTSVTLADPTASDAPSEILGSSWAATEVILDEGEAREGGAGKVDVGGDSSPCSALVRLGRARPQPTTAATLDPTPAPPSSGPATLAIRRTTNLDAPSLDLDDSDGIDSCVHGRLPSSHPVPPSARALALELPAGDAV